MKSRLILIYCWFCLLLAIGAGVWVGYDMYNHLKQSDRLNTIEKHLDDIEKTMKHL